MQELKVSFTGYDYGNIMPLLVIGSHPIQAPSRDLAGLIKARWPKAIVGPKDTLNPGEYDLFRPYAAEVIVRHDWDWETVAMLHGDAQSLSDIQRFVS